MWPRSTPRAGKSAEALSLFPTFQLITNVTACQNGVRHSLPFGTARRPERSGAAPGLARGLLPRNWGLRTYRLNRRLLHSSVIISAWKLSQGLGWLLWLYRLLWHTQSSRQTLYGCLCSQSLSLTSDWLVSLGQSLREPLQTRFEAGPEHVFDKRLLFPSPCGIMDLWMTSH